MCVCVCARTLLHGDVGGAGVGGLQQLLVGLRRLVEQLDQQSARLLVLAAPDGGQLVQLLLHQAGVIERILQTVSVDALDTRVQQHNETH